MKADLDGNKDLGRELGAADGSKADVAYAIYDGGDTKSKANQIVKRIQLQGDLSEDDRARLLKAHEDSVMAVDSQLAEDRRRQEQELDRALKERLERRKAAKKKLNKDELQDAVNEITADVNEDFADKKATLMDDLEKLHRQEQDAIYKEQGSGTDQAKKLRDCDRKQ